MGAFQRNSMQQNEIYNIPLPRGPGSKKKTKNKKKGNERGINYPGGLKRRIPQGDTKYLLGTVV
jgi:hypothetical protein